MDKTARRRLGLMRGLLQRAASPGNTNGRQYENGVDGSAQHNASGEEVATRSRRPRVVSAAVNASDATRSGSQKGVSATLAVSHQQRAIA